MQISDYKKQTRHKAAVIDSVRITPEDSAEEVREISIEINSQDFRAEVGQNIGVLAPGRSEIGQEHHFRLYSIADIPQMTPAGCQRVRICVRRCNYIDAFSGEAFPGVASNFLCDLRASDTLTVTGPHGQPFDVPRDHDAALILICAGTGIAPFRAFVKHIYTNRPDFSGRIWLFHGGQTGLDLLYRNKVKDDFSLYYDRKTFEAFNALSSRPGWTDKTAWGNVIHDRSEELCDLLTNSKTYVYLSGLKRIGDELDSVLAEVAGSKQSWLTWKAALTAEGRWVELLY
jgi:ferredoxin--NADP+ reductase